jgi:myo-inositol-1(or 4)-monophosphatase
MKETADVKSLCLAVTELARKAGKFILNEGLSFDLNKIEYKGARDMVSYVDKQAEKILVEGLRKILPEAGFITEEETVIREDKELKWVIDPLDGTTNFLHSLPTYSVSVALICRNEILLGVVYEPNLDECFYAWKNGGAWCNKKRIQVSSIDHLERSLVATGFPYSLLGKENAYFEIMKKFVEETHGLRRLGSAAVDLAYVACGRFEAYYEYNLNFWDVAAGILLVKEAGGKITDFSGGNDYLYGKEVIAAGALHSEALRIIQEYWK